MELTKEQKLIVCNIVLKHYLNDTNESVGLCFTLRDAIHESGIYGSRISSSETSNYIPELLQVKPKRPVGLLWWDKDNIKSRIRAVRKLIKIIENE